MKRVCTLLILVFVTVSLCAQNSPKEFWVYRNDGLLHGFRAELIDSITCSKMDMDSIIYEDYVVQEIWMEDSVCRIPLNAIDSIGFITPSTIYKNDVLVISDELREYVLSVSSSEIQLEKTCPEQLLPSIGQKIVTIKIDANFHSGFMGKVSNIERNDSCIVIQCEDAMLSEIFDRYYTTFAIGVQPTQVADGRKKSISVTPIRNDTIDLTIPYKIGPTINEAECLQDYIYTKSESSTGCFLNINGELSIYDGRMAGFFAFDGIRPSFVSGLPEPIIDFSLTIVGNKGKGAKIRHNVDIIGGIEASFNNDFSKKADVIFLQTKNGGCIKDDLAKIIIPIGPTGIVVEGVAGIAVSGEASLGLGAGFETEGEICLSYSFSNNPLAKHNIIRGGSFELTKFEFHPIISGEAAVRFGPFLEVDIAILEKGIGKVGLRLEGGAEIGLKARTSYDHLLRSQTTTEMYDDFINDCGWTLSPYTTISLVFGLGPLEIPFDFDIPWDKFFPKLKIDLANFVPTFSTSDYYRNKNIGLKGLVYPECLVGYKVTNEKSEEVYKYYYPDSYGIKPFSNINPLPLFNTIPVTIPSNIRIKKDYKIYPLVKVYKLFEMTASPAIDLFLVQITDVSTTTALYRPTDNDGCFEYEDKKYEFKYGVTTKVQLGDDGDDVEKWGYCYDGPDRLGKTRINLMGASSEVEDGRFSYYRNGNPHISDTIKHHTANLFPFIKYTDETDYRYGTPVDYPLIYPDPDMCTMTLKEELAPNLITTTDKVFGEWMYDYCTTITFEYDAVGAYWFTVKAEEEGDAWKDWDNHLMDGNGAKAADGVNKLTVNYFYNKKELNGTYYLRLIGVGKDEAGKDYEDKTLCSTLYIELLHDGEKFIGCKVPEDQPESASVRRAENREESGEPYLQVINLYSK